MTFGRIAYEKRKFGAPALRVIELANQICDEYAQQGYDITLRQLYYQFVARGYIANKQTEYKRLGDIINNARMAGHLSWDYIVDRTRNVNRPASWESPQDILEAVASQFRLDPWLTQDDYVEVWVEKEALAGVIQRSAQALRCPSLACRGYMSQSEQHAAAMRFADKIRKGKTVHVIHLGDHDPSGIDMSRDNRERLELFILNTAARELNAWGPVAGIRQRMRDEYNSGGLVFDRIALNMDQVEEHDPPPNPAKMSDSRAEDYVARFGDESWELDALPPDVLDGLIRDAIEPLIDDDAWNAVMAQEDFHKAALADIAARYDELTA